MNKTMEELAKSLIAEKDSTSASRCIYCGKEHPDVAPINGPDAWTIVPDKIHGFASVCPDCNKLDAKKTAITDALKHAITQLSSDETMSLEYPIKLYVAEPFEGTVALIVFNELLHPAILDYAMVLLFELVDKFGCGLTATDLRTIEVSL